MKKLLDKETEKQLQEMFKDIKNSVNLMFFSKENCENCSITEQLLNELTSLNERLSLTVYDINKETTIAKTYGIEAAPSFILLNSQKEKAGSIFYGVPSGHEFATLISNIIDVGIDFPLFEENILQQIETIKTPIDIKVFVTVQCPHCTGAAINASRLALLNPNINATIYESQTFHEIANKYQVSGVPKIVINETNELLGNQPIEAFLTAINKL